MKISRNLSFSRHYCRINWQNGIILPQIKWVVLKKNLSQLIPFYSSPLSNKKCKKFFFSVFGIFFNWNSPYRFSTAFFFRISDPANRKSVLENSRIYELVGKLLRSRLANVARERTKNFGRQWSEHVSFRLPRMDTMKRNIAAECLSYRVYTTARSASEEER